MIVVVEGRGHDRSAASAKSGGVESEQDKRARRARRARRTTRTGGVNLLIYSI